jgi:hypothetical protein
MEVRFMDGRFGNPKKLTPTPIVNLETRWSTLQAEWIFEI